MSAVIYESDPQKIVALVKAGHEVMHPRVLLQQQIEERGKAACEVLRARGILLTSPSKGEGFVYVFVAGQHVKIGMTHLDVEARWLTIRSHNPILERPFYCTPALKDKARVVERASHESLNAHHISGEWFLCSQEMAIKAVQQAMEEICHD